MILFQNKNSLSLSDVDENEEFNYGFKDDNDFDPLEEMNNSAIKKHFRRKSCCCGFCGTMKRHYKGLYIVLESDVKTQSENKLRENNSAFYRNRTNLDKIITAKQTSDFLKNLVTEHKHKGKFEQMSTLSKREQIILKEKQSFIKKNTEILKQLKSLNKHSLKLQRKESTANATIRSNCGDTTDDILKEKDYPNACPHSKEACYRCIILFQMERNKNI